MKRVLVFVAEFGLVVSLTILFAKIAHLGEGSWPTIAATAVATGLLGNYVYRWIERSAETAKHIAPDGRLDGILPVNHDLGRAIRDAQLSATIALALALLSQYREAIVDWSPAAWREYRRLKQFVRQVRRWARQARREWNAKREPKAVRLIAAMLVDLVAMDLAEDAPSVLGLDFWRRAAAVTLAEMRDAGIDDMPDMFVEAMRHPTGPVSWRAAVKSFFLESLKTDDSVFRVVMLQLEMAMLRMTARGLPARRLRMLMEVEPADRRTLTLPPLAADEAQ